MINDSLDNVYARIRAEEREALSRRIDDAYFRAPRLKELDEECAKLFSDLGARRITADAGKLRLVRLNEIGIETRYLVDNAGYSIKFGGDRILV